MSHARQTNAHSASPFGMVVVPKNAIVRKTAESIPCPTIVEPMVRVHRNRPCVTRFSRASTYEFANSPTRNARKLPPTILHVCPRIVS